MERPNQSVQAMSISDKSLATFQSSYNFLLGALENSNGTSSTSVAKEFDTTAGRTPQALRMMAERENTRDMMDRYQMEVTVQDIVEKFVNLQANKMEAPLILSLFRAEVETIAKEFPDIVELFESGEGAKVIIDRELLRGKYRFEIDSGSMIKRDDELELQNLNTMLQVVLNNAQVSPQTGKVISPLINAMEENGKRINIAELFKQWVIKAGVNDWDKIIIEEQDGDISDGERGIPIDQAEQEILQFEQQLGMQQGQQMIQPMQPQQPAGGEKIYA